MDRLTSQQRHDKAAIKQEQSDACISSAERGEVQLSTAIRKIRIPSDNCDEQGVLLYNLDKADTSVSLAVAGCDPEELASPIPVGWRQPSYKSKWVS